jgi:hypothetical protein
MLTARPPFAAHSALAQMRQHLEEPAPRPSLRAPAAAPLDAIVLRCMEKDPDRRYASVAELLSAVRDAMRAPDRESGVAPSAGEVGVAIYVEIRVRGAGDVMDLELAEHVGDALDLAEDLLRDAGLLVAFTTSNQVLGVRPLSSDRAAEAARLVDVAVRLRKKLDERAQAHDRIRANVCVHADRVTVGADGSSESLGGPLLCTDLWAPEEEVGPVCLTAGATRLLDGAQPLAPTLPLVSLPQLDPERTLHPRARRQRSRDRA